MAPLWAPALVAGILMGGEVALAVGASEVVVGSVRVQALSPTLLRIEPRGPRGFEDRPTFMVPNRSALGTGIDIWVNASSPEGTWIATDFYKVWLSEGPSEDFLVTSPAGRQLLRGSLKSVGNLLHWPSPLEAAAYAVADQPRFAVPPWGPVPIPPGEQVDPELLGTNGFDFRNNHYGDTYVFLLGDSLDSWGKSRREFLSLTGKIPVLPDYAYGIWYTRYWLYTEAEAKEEIDNFTIGGFPLDVYGLDMNWRQYKCGSYVPGGSESPCCKQLPNSSCPDRFYKHPNSSLFPDFPTWFEYIRSQGLRSYFNDHPFPVDRQTTPAEVAFRWDGLTEWLSKGLDFWWFDRNWGYSIQPPSLPIDTSEPSWEECPRKGVGSWQGLSNIVWGSYVYFSTIESWNRVHRPGERPVLLSRDSEPNWRPGMDSALQDGVPAHHRYPVWWLGDGVPLETSVAMMVDEGVHSFRPFVHPDCGGNGVPPAPTFLRWVQHCVFAPVIRFHAGDLPPGNHRFWIYDGSTQATIRGYLQLRARLAPSLVAAGRAASTSGFPLLARCDLFWPEYFRAQSNLQYLFLNNTLVAPFFGNDTLPNSSEPGNMTQVSRPVWIPPGAWQDAWNGSVIMGPQNATVTRGFGRIPLWHRLGSVVVLAADPGLRVVRQDWSELVAEVFPLPPSTGTVAGAFPLRQILALDEEDETEVALQQDEDTIVLSLTPAGPKKVARSWVLRFHLLPGQQPRTALVDGKPSGPQVLEPLQPDDAGRFFPFSGPGARPPPRAGLVAEVRLESSSLPRSVALALAPPSALLV